MTCFSTGLTLLLFGACDAAGVSFVNSAESGWEDMWHTRIGVKAVGSTTQDVHTTFSGGTKPTSRRAPNATVVELHVGSVLDPPSHPAADRSASCPRLCAHWQPEKGVRWVTRESAAPPPWVVVSAVQWTLPLWSRPVHRHVPTL